MCVRLGLLSMMVVVASMFSGSGFSAKGAVVSRTLMRLGVSGKAVAQGVAGGALLIAAVCGNIGCEKMQTVGDTVYARSGTPSSGDAVYVSASDVRVDHYGDTNQHGQRVSTRSVVSELTYGVNPETGSMMIRLARPDGRYSWEAHLSTPSYNENFDVAGRDGSRAGSGSVNHLGDLNLEFAVGDGRVIFFDLDWQSRDRASIQGIFAKLPNAGNSYAGELNPSELLEFPLFGDSSLTALWWRIAGEVSHSPSDSDSYSFPNAGTPTVYLVNSAGYGMGSNRLTLAGDGDDRSFIYDGIYWRADHGSAELKYALRADVGDFLLRVNDGQMTSDFYGAFPGGARSFDVLDNSGTDIGDGSRDRWVVERETRLQFSYGELNVSLTIKPNADWSSVSVSGEIRPLTGERVAFLTTETNASFFHRFQGVANYDSGRSAAGF